VFVCSTGFPLQSSPAWTVDAAGITARDILRAHSCGFRTFSFLAIPVDVTALSLA
jgi:hypothetical protein